MITEKKLLLNAHLNHYMNNIMMLLNILIFYKYLISSRRENNKFLFNMIYVIKCVCISTYINMYTVFFILIIRLLIFPIQRILLFKSLLFSRNKPKLKSEGSIKVDKNELEKLVNKCLNNIFFCYSKRFPTVKVYHCISAFLLIHG